MTLHRISLGVVLGALAAGCHPYVAAGEPGGGAGPGYVGTGIHDGGADGGNGADGGVNAWVVPLYLAAIDSPELQVSQRSAELERTLLALRQWYGDAMGTPYGNETFGVAPQVVLRSHNTQAQWNASDFNGCSVLAAVELELRDGGLLSNAGLPPLGSPGTLYAAVAGGGAAGDGCAAHNSLAAFDAQLIDNVLVYCPTGFPDGGGGGCNSVGLMAQQLGLAFGLRPCSQGGDCNSPSIVNNPNLYPTTALSPADRAALAASPFFLPP